MLVPPPRGFLFASQVLELLSEGFSEDYSTIPEWNCTSIQYPQRFEIESHEEFEERKAEFGSWTLNQKRDCAEEDILYAFSIIVGFGGLYAWFTNLPDASGGLNDRDKQRIHDFLSAQQKTLQHFLGFHPLLKRDAVDRFLDPSVALVRQDGQVALRKKAEAILN